MAAVTKMHAGVMCGDNGVVVSVVMWSDGVLVTL